MASNNTNDFYVQLMAALDPTSVNKEFDALKKKLAKDPVIQKVTLDTSMSKQAIKDMATEIHNELGKAFKETGIESFDITVKDVESILASAVKESNKLAKELDTASSKAQKFLAQFNNKSGGTLVNSKEFKAVQDAISGLGKTHSIDDLNKAMNTLETTYNNMVSSLRNSGKSLNPFINAKNEMATMDDTIKGIGLEFEKLANKPKSVSDAIKQLSVQQANVNSFTVGTQEWADAYGKLQQMIQKVKSEISNLQKAQSAKVAVQIFDPAELDKQGRIYVKKVNNTIEKTKSEIESKLRNDKKNRWTDIQITGVEKANGQIKSLTVQATNAAGAFKELRFEAQKIATNSKKGYQTGLVQTSEVKTLKGNMSQMRQTVQTTLDGLKSKWQEQGVLVGDFKTKVEQLQTSLASVGSKGELNNLKSQMESLKTQASQIAEVNKIQLSMSTGGYESKVDSLIGKTQQWVDANGNARISTNALQTAMNNLNTAYANITATGGNTVANQQALIQAEQALDVEVKKVQSSITSMNATMAKSTAVDSLRQKVQMFYDTNTKSHRTYGAQLRAIVSELATGAEVPITKLRQLSQEFIGIQNSARQAGKLGLSFFDTLKQGMQKFSYWTSSTFLVMKTIQSIKSAVSTVKELDTALVDLKKTTTMTAKELEDFYYASNETAKKMGVTTQAIIEQASAWSRLGYSSQEAATKMAEYSSMFATISPGMDLDSATDGLVSVMKAFKIGAEDVDDVVDGIMSKINIIGNTQALNNSDIVDFLTRSSSAMAEANNSLEETIALGTAATEITRDAASVGNMLKTVSMRIRGYDEETESYSEELENLSGTIANLTKTASTPGGVSLFADASKTTYKSTYQILKDISEIYDELDDKTQAELLEALAGKRQGQAVAAIINNFENAEKSMESMANSAGNAEAEMAIAIDSIAYKSNTLSEIGTGISQNLFGREDMKAVLDTINSLGEGIQWLTDKLGLFGTIAMGGGLFAGIKNIGQDKMWSCLIYAYPC